MAAWNYLFSGIGNTPNKVFSLPLARAIFIKWESVAGLHCGKTTTGCVRARVMSGQGSAGQQQVASKQDLVDPAANFVNRGDYGTLILDRQGRVLSCGIPAERLFRTSQLRLIEHLISDFVAGLFPGASSPGEQQACPLDSCVDGEWRRFVARDAEGQAFAVELKLVRMATPSPDREMFLLNVRRPALSNRQ